VTLTDFELLRLLLAQKYDPERAYDLNIAAAEAARMYHGENIKVGFVAFMFAEPSVTPVCRKGWLRSQRYVFHLDNGSFCSLPIHRNENRLGKARQNCNYSELYGECTETCNVYGSYRPLSVGFSHTRHKQAKANHKLCYLYILAWASVAGSTVL